MHELSIVHDVLDTALAEGRRHGAKRVTAVVLRLGTLRGVEPENLRFLFPLAARGTAAEGALLEIEADPVRYSCRSCRRTGESDAVLAACPGCGAAALALSGGEDLRVVAIDVEEE